MQHLAEPYHVSMETSLRKEAVHKHFDAGAQVCPFRGLMCVKGVIGTCAPCSAQKSGAHRVKSAESAHLWRGMIAAMPRRPVKGRDRLFTDMTHLL